MKTAFAGFAGRRLAFALRGAACLLLASAPLCATEQEAAREGRQGFAAPGRGEILAPGAILEVRWGAPCDADAPRDDLDRDRFDGEGERGRDSGRAENEAELVLSLDGGMTFPIRVSGELSPCASRFSWRVPALPSAQARLGLRTGEDERDEEERIEVVSEAFTILPDPERRPEALYARGGEWWIPESPSLRGAEESLRPSLGAPRSHLATAVAWTEIAAPVSPALARPSAQTIRAVAARPLKTPSSVLSLASAPAAPTPLRC